MECGRFAIDGDVLDVYARAIGVTRGLHEGAVREMASQLRRAASGGAGYVNPQAIRQIVSSYAGGGGGGGAFGGLGNNGGGGGGLGSGMGWASAPVGGGASTGGYFASSRSSSGGADPYFGPSPTYDATGSSSGGGYGGSGGGAIPGTSATAGTRHNPLVVEMYAGKRDWVALVVKLALWGVLGYFIWQSMGGAKGMPGPLAQLAGDIAEEVTDAPTTRFADVKGVDEAKHELEDIVAFLRDPEKFRRLGAKVPRGVLLTGPPGTGKTLLARAVAGEAGCKFYSKSAAEFEEMLVGLGALASEVVACGSEEIPLSGAVSTGADPCSPPSTFLCSLSTAGARRVRDLFNAAKKNAPAIIFIDEIDALGGKRKVSIGGGSERQTLNQLLSSMDGFSKNENVIVIAATNTPEILDPALTRPGRFDSTVNVPLPDVKGRQEIIELYLSRVVASPSVDPLLLARATPGFSGAQIEALINSAALMAAQRGADSIQTADVEEARDKIIMGPAKKSRVKKEEQMRLTAYHEGGHTLTAVKTRGAHDLHKVTILPRGFSGGATYSLPRDDELETKEAILAAIDVCMGGRVAEELVYGENRVTTGAGMDMRQASDLARRFTMAYSMSSLGLTSYADGTEPSPAKKAAIDSEVERILQESYGRVKSLLTTSRPQLDLLAGALLEHETLDADEVRAVIDGKTLPSLREKIAKQSSAKPPATAAGSGAAAAAKAAGALKGAAAAAAAGKKGGSSGGSSGGSDGPSSGGGGDGGASGGGSGGGGSKKVGGIWAIEQPDSRPVSVTAPSSSQLQ